MATLRTWSRTSPSSHLLKTIHIPDRSLQEPLFTTCLIKPTPLTCFRLSFTSQVPLENTTPCPLSPLTSTCMAKWALQHAFSSMKRGPLNSLFEDRLPYYQARGEAWEGGVTFLGERKDQRAYKRGRKQAKRGRKQTWRSPAGRPQN